MGMRRALSPHQPPATTTHHPHLPYHHPSPTTMSPLIIRWQWVGALSNAWDYQLQGQANTRFVD